MFFVWATDRRSSPQGTTAGLNRNVFVTECHRSRAVYSYETGWFNGAAVSPSHRLWTAGRRDSRLNLDPLKTTLWIWNGACRWAKFSASEKHRNHGQSSAVSAKKKKNECVLTFLSGCLSDGAALTETAGSRCGCLLTRGDRSLIPGDWYRACPQQAVGDLWLCYNVMICWVLFLFMAEVMCVNCYVAMCMWVCDRKQGPCDFGISSMICVWCFIMKGRGHSMCWTVVERIFTIGSYLYFFVLFLSNLYFCCFKLFTPFF